MVHILCFTCDKEYVMATRVPNPVISFDYTSSESLLHKLSCNVKYVLIYTRTHLTQSNEPRVLCHGCVILVLGSHSVSRDFFNIPLIRTHVTSKMASSRS